MSTNGTVTGLTDLRARLREARVATDRAALLEGSLRVLFWSAAALLLALLAEGTLRLNVPLRTALAAAVLLVPLVLVLRGVLPPILRLLGLLRGETDEQAAVRVGRRFPVLHDRLVNGLQLAREQEGYYSAALIEASLCDIERDAAGLDFTSVADPQPAARLARRVGALLGAGALMWLVFTPILGGAADRLRRFSTEFTPPPPFLLEVEPGTVEVVKGATVPVRVRVTGAAPSSVTLGLRPEGQSAVEQVTLTPDSAGLFNAPVGPLKRSTVYFAAAGDQRSDEYTLRVVDRPAVRALRVSLTFPSYTRLPARQLDENVGDVTALRGTRVTLAVESTKELAAAAIVYDAGEEAPMATEDARASGSVTLLRDRRYTLRLADREGLVNQDPIEYRLSVLADAHPQISLELPGRDLAVTDNGSVTLAARIRDDFGFSAVRLAFRLSQSRYERPAETYTVVPLPLPVAGSVEALVQHVWQLAGLNLVPEDVVTYYMEVADNDAVTGPKTARTAEYTLRLPSMEEVFAAADRGHEEGIRSLQETLQEAEQARKEAEELRRALQKQQQRMDWQEQKKAEEVLKKYDEMRKRLDEAQKTVDDMLQQMQQHDALSPETLEKYRQLQQLMEQMNSPEFADAMKKVQQAMQQMSPEMMREALKNFSFSEENFRRSIERTMNLLKRLQIEQKMDEALRRAEEMLREQEEAARRTEQAREGDTKTAEELARRQEELARQAERASAAMRDLERQMEEFPAEMPMEEMREARESIDSTGLDEQMRETARELREGDREASRQLQRRSLRSLTQHRDRLQQAQKAMQANQQRQAMNEMRRSLEDLLGLSRRQEELKNDARTLEQNSERFRQNASQQMDVMRELSSLADRMGTLSNKTFAVTPEMGKAIGDAMRRMNDAMQALDQRDGLQAGQQQQGAMASLNEAASLVQGSMNAMMQGGGQGTGMASFLQRLQQMSGQQQGINQATRQTGGLTPQQAAELGRIAGEQGMVRKSLEQLAREAAQTGELSKLLGDLNRTAQEMREVQTDLAQGAVTTETLRKQDRILSRLLDSQRSARERDYEKQRRAQTGTATDRRSPGPVDMSTQEGKDRLRQDLLRALEEGYARDYEELIRKYFEALDTAVPPKANTP